MCVRSRCCSRRRRGFSAFSLAFLGLHWKSSSWERQADNSKFVWSLVNRKELERRKIKAAAAPNTTGQQWTKSGHFFSEEEQTDSRWLADWDKTKKQKPAAAASFDENKSERKTGDKLSADAVFDNNSSSSWCGGDFCCCCCCCCLKLEYDGRNRRKCSLSSSGSACCFCLANYFFYYFSDYFLIGWLPFSSMSVKQWEC